MNIAVRNVSFGFAGGKIFSNFSINFAGAERPVVILGSSGSGKTTLLKLLGGLLAPQEGSIEYPDTDEAAPKTAFIFQEPRLLPWLTALENISLPLEKLHGREKAIARAKHFLSLVFLDDKADSYPRELSGGQAQRVSMARAFAWSAPAIFMDEPYQSLDVPLRLKLMDLPLSLLREEKRLFITVTHDPREAVYMGGRIIVLGKPGEGIVFDRIVDLSDGDRAYGSPVAGELEKELLHYT
jgi:NitT/TauT family transport system ATP-binding protein